MNEQEFSSIAAATAGLWPRRGWPLLSGIGARLFGGIPYADAEVALLERADAGDEYPPDPPALLRRCRELAASRRPALPPPPPPTQEEVMAQLARAIPPEQAEDYRLISARLHGTLDGRRRQQLISEFMAKRPPAARAPLRGPLADAIDGAPQPRGPWEPSPAVLASLEEQIRAGLPVPSRYEPYVGRIKAKIAEEGAS